jgi:hypothetical protein
VTLKVRENFLPIAYFIFSVLSGMFSAAILGHYYSDNVILVFIPLLNSFGLLSSLLYSFNYLAYDNIKKSLPAYSRLIVPNLIVSSFIVLAIMISDYSLFTKSLAAVYLLSCITFPMSKYFIAGNDYQMFMVGSILVLLLRPVVLFGMQNTNEFALVTALFASQLFNTIFYLWRAKITQVRLFDKEGEGLSYSLKVYMSGAGIFLPRVGISILFYIGLTFYGAMDYSEKTMSPLLVLLAGIVFSVAGASVTFFERMMEGSNVKFSYIFRYLVLIASIASGAFIIFILFYDLINYFLLAIFSNIMSYETALFLLGLFVCESLRVLYVHLCSRTNSGSSHNLKIVLLSLLLLCTVNFFDHALSYLCFVIVSMILLYLVIIFSISNRTQQGEGA